MRFLPFVLAVLAWSECSLRAGIEQVVLADTPMLETFMISLDNQSPQHNYQACETCASHPPHRAHLSLLF